MELRGGPRSRRRARGAAQRLRRHEGDEGRVRPGNHALGGLHRGRGGAQPPHQEAPVVRNDGRTRGRRARSGEGRGRGVDRVLRRRRERPRGVLEGRDDGREVRQPDHPPGRVAREARRHAGEGGQGARRALDGQERSPPLRRIQGRLLARDEGGLRGLRDVGRLANPLHHRRLRALPARLAAGADMGRAQPVAHRLRRTLQLRPRRSRSRTRRSETGTAST